MKQRFLIFIFISFNFTCLADHQSSVTVSSEAAKREKMPILIGIVGKKNEELLPVASFLKGILRCDQYKTVGFLATEQQFERTPAQWTIKKLARQYPIALFLSLSRDGKTLEWRLYDTQNASMVKGQRFARKDYTFRLQAEHLADELWPTLTGQPGFFSTRIAFCKEVPNKKIRGLKQMCLISPYANPAQEQYTELRDQLMFGKLFAPRWNNDTGKPLLLYSESTLSNVRLMSVDLQRKRRVVSNFEGLNILPTFSTDGKRVVYCLSHDGLSQLYLYEFDTQNKQASLKRLMCNQGNNISPVLCENGDIVFCSDNNTRGPQICYYHAETNMIDRLTSGGYCACPSMCAHNNVLAYCKLTDGVMQVFLYDMKTKKHEQITFDYSNKEECTWSPCGTYLAFTVDDGKSSRIAVLNLLTKERSFITPANERCIYPSWSPKYKLPLIVS
jgi:TolB protein